MGDECTTFDVYSACEAEESMENMECGVHGCKDHLKWRLRDRAGFTEFYVCSYHYQGLLRSKYLRTGPHTRLVINAITSLNAMTGYWPFPPPFQEGEEEKGKVQSEPFGPTWFEVHSACRAEAPIECEVDGCKAHQRWRLMREDGNTLAYVCGFHYLVFDSNRSQGALVMSHHRRLKRGRDCGPFPSNWLQITKIRFSTPGDHKGCYAHKCQEYSPYTGYTGLTGDRSKVWMCTKHLTELGDTGVLVVENQFGLKWSGGSRLVHQLINDKDTITIMDAGTQIRHAKKKARRTELLERAEEKAVRKAMRWTVEKADREIAKKYPPKEVDIKGKAKRDDLLLYSINTVSPYLTAPFKSAVTGRNCVDHTREGTNHTIYLQHRHDQEAYDREKAGRERFCLLVEVGTGINLAVHAGSMAELWDRFQAAATDVLPGMVHLLDPGDRKAVPTAPPTIMKTHLG